MTNLQTIVNSKKKSENFLHPFMPSLGIELALQEGVPLNIGDVKLTKKLLANNEESGYYKWGKTYPPDYDDTITALNMFNLLNEPKRKQLNFDFSRNGGIFTYKGGLESKSNNNVDLLINLRILDYLQNSESDSESYLRLIEFLKREKNEFFKSVQQISKYYCSEGFLLYSLSKVSNLLDINIDEIIDYKKDILNSEPDKQLAFLASQSNKQLLNEMELFKENDFYLFQHPRLGLKFKNNFLEKVITEATQNKLNPSFNEWVSKIYDSNGRTLYSYKQDSDALENLFEKYSINSKSTIVELAVGTGNFLEKMITKYPKIIGIDTSEFMLEKAKEKLPKANLKNVKAQNLKINADVIYSTNFIDLYGMEVQIWAKGFQESEEIINNIATQINSNGYFFLHKKENKKTLSFELNIESAQEKNKIKTVYFYQDEKTIYRNEFEKVVYSFEDFNKKMITFGLKKIDENDNWIMYKR